MTTAFTKDVKIKYDFKYKGKWFDSCPVEGTSEYKSDLYCSNHIRVIDKGDHFIIMNKPNFNHKERPFQSDWMDNFYMYRLYKDKVWEAVNEFNNSRCIYIMDLCIGEDYIELDDELVSWLGCYGDTLVQAKVKTYEQCDELEKVMDVNTFEAVIK